MRTLATLLCSAAVCSVIAPAALADGEAENRKALDQLTYVAPDTSFATPAAAPAGTPKSPTPSPGAIAMERVVINAPEIKLNDTPPPKPAEPDLETPPLIAAPFDPVTGGTMWTSESGRTRVGLWRWHDLRKGRGWAPPKVIRVEVIRIDLGK